MHYTGQVYRHPMEGYTPLLEVTIGCSHNKCAFCTMYNETKFSVSPMEHVEEDLEELKSYGVKIPRIYLVNADPFVLSFEKLAAIGQLIRKYFPEIQVITGYASVNNLKNKSEAQLKELKALGFDQLHIGLETAYPPALELMQKGFTVDEAQEQLTKLKAAGMSYDALLMMGVAGRGNGKANVEATAAFLNRIRPYMVSIMPTSVTPGSRLEVLCQQGLFEEPTEREMIEEEIALLKALEFDDAFFFGSHNYNLVPISGPLSREKQRIIDHLQQALLTIDPKTLDCAKPRGPI